MAIKKRPKRVPATTARVHLGEMLRRVKKGEDIVIEKDGIPTAALIDVADYEEYRRLREAAAGADADAEAVRRWKPTPEGLERLRRAAGGWKDVDPEAFLKRLREGRVFTRPSVRL